MNTFWRIGKDSPSFQPILLFPAFIGSNVLAIRFSLLLNTWKPGSLRLATRQHPVQLSEVDIMVTAEFSI